MSYFVKLWGESFRHSLFVGESGGHKFWLNCPFSKKRNALTYVTIFFVEIVLSPRSLNCIWNKPNLPANTSSWSDFLQYAKIFRKSLIHSDLTSGISTDILINVLEDCTLFLILALWALFDFHLKQQQQFSVWIFTENASFVSFQGGIRSIYSEL